MKKNFLVFLCVILLLIPFITTASAATETKSKLNMNFVIVMDNSGSLEKADPQKLCVEGAKLFADLLPMKNTKVGFIVFGGDVVYQRELLNVNDIGQKKGLKGEIKREMDYSQHLTDIGDGLEAAIKMLEDAKAEAKTGDDTKSAILLFTDGAVRVYKSDYEATLKQIDDAVAAANKNGWPIYTIGLNYKGNANEGMLKYISQTTGAGDPLLTPETSQMLPYYTEIFKRFMDIDALMTEEVISNGFADFTIMQPEMATEINIVLTGAGIESAELTDPQENAVDLENEAQVYYTREKGYILLKILQSQPGPWKLHVEGGNGQKVYVQTLNTFDLPLVTDVCEEKNGAVKFDPSQDINLKKNETVVFDSYLVYNDTRSEMPGFYNTTTAKVILTDTETKAKTEYNMQALKDGYTLSLPMPAKGTFEAQVFVDTPSFKRESDIYTIVVENAPVEAVGIIPPVDMKAGDSSTIDLSQYFIDPYGDKLTYSFNLKDSELAALSTEQNTLTITAPGKAGAADITVTADDGDGSTASQSFSLSVISLFDYYYKQVGAYVIGALAFILLIVLIRYLFTKIRGSMKIWIATEEAEANAVTFAEYTFIPTRLRLGKGRIKGKKFNLSDLLNKYSSYLFKNYEELNFPGTGAFKPVKFKGVVFGRRAKIRLKPRNANIVLEVVGNSEKKPPFKIKPGQTITATITEENKTIKVFVEYIG